MIKEINRNAVFVTGAVRSAIYDFAAGNVYSINYEGTKILSDYFLGSKLSNINSEFISEVNKIVKIDSDYISDYVFAPIKPGLHFVWLELTQRCNFRCVHCYQGNGHDEPSTPLSVPEWKSVILQCADANCHHIQFIGGEPSTCEYLPQLIEYAYHVGIENITIFSNLFFMPDILISTIVKYHVSVSFSIYGACAAIHDSITQIPGSFERLVSRIIQLRDLDVSLRANVVIMRENEDCYTEIADLLHTLGINSIHYDEIRKVYGGTQNPHMPIKPKSVRRHPNFRADRELFKRANTNTCWFGKLVISTDGSIFPCEFEREISYGNIRQLSISDVLMSDIVKKYWYFSYDNVIPCKDCEYRFACKDCRPIAYAEHGCITDKNPRCCYNPMTGEWKEEINYN